MKLSSLRFPLAACALILLLSSCGHKQRFTLSGTLQNGAGKTVYLEELSPEGPIFIDSVKLDSKGSFTYKYDLPYKTFINLHASPTDYVVLLPDFGEKICIEGCYDSLVATYTLKGAGDSQLLYQLQRFTNDGTQVLRQVVATDQQNRQLLESGAISEDQFDAAHSVTDSIFLSAFQEQQAYMAQIIEEHAGSLATIIALYKPFNNQPLLSPERNFDYYDIVLKGLEESLPDNPHTINFKNTVEHYRFQYAAQ